MFGHKTESLKSEPGGTFASSSRARVYCPSLGKSPSGPCLAESKGSGFTQAYVPPNEEETELYTVGSVNPLQPAGWIPYELQRAMLTIFPDKIDDFVLLHVRHRHPVTPGY